MKTMGVLGGLGPQATMDFEARVHAVSQRLIVQDGNRGYPPMVVYYFRQPPVLINDDGKVVVPLQPNPLIFEVVQKLATLADFIVISANGPHFMHEEIEQASGLKVLSMIDLVLEEAQRRGWKYIGLLGLGDPHVYQEPLDALGIAYETTSGDVRSNLDRSILGYMEGKQGARPTAHAIAAVDALRDRNVDGVILGCTEVPLLLGDELNAPDLINPAQLLAEAAVRYAME